jgi:tetratricopeptide (TPR) repeat protein
MRGQERKLRFVPALLALGCCVAPASLAEVYSWVDEQGVTHLTDDPAALPEGERAGRVEGREALRGLWPSVLAEELAPPAPGDTSSSEEDRTRRLLRGALADLERGENARAIATLHAVLRDQPGRPEAHWLLALISRQRGRYEAAEVHLESFLATAGDRFGPLRASAERRLAELADERRLADPDLAGPAGSWRGVAHPHFKVHFRSELAEASPDYAERVLANLESARRAVGERLGAYPAEPLGVVLYGKAAYLQAHRHRFSFQTVGFFDGRIHVVSAAHPKGELRALLHHEYTHAIYREQTGGDRPYWLNEGLSELSERAAHGRSGMTRGERAALRGRIEAGTWIPLRRIAPSFSGLDNEDARAAYLEALAAASWIEQRTAPEDRAQLLALLGAGYSDDEALGEVLALDTPGVDAAVRADILADFPANRSLPGETKEAGEERDGEAAGG